MSGAITTTVSSPGASAASSANDATASLATAKERALLAKLLRTYQTDINKGQSANLLKSLAKQITDTAKLLGQNVSLPKATTGSASASDFAPAPAEAKRPVQGQHQSIASRSPSAQIILIVSPRGVETLSSGMPPGSVEKRIMTECVPGWANRPCASVAEVLAAPATRLAGCRGSWRARCARRGRNH